MKLIQELKQIRKAQGISQDALSMMLGQSGNGGSYISHLENGRHPTVQVATIQKMADALGYELVLRPKA